MSADVCDKTWWSYGWFNYQVKPGEPIHQLPNYDLGSHHLVNCACRPRDDGEVIVHNSFDGREAFETGQRKMS